MPVYIHERIEIEGGGRGKYIELVRGDWATHARERYGVRLAGVWATVGSTANWPEAQLLWEMDDWDHFARAMESQYPLEDKDSFGTELWYQALDYRQRGQATLLELAAPLRVPQDAGAAIYLYEDVRSKAGALGDYHRALAREYVPVAESRGLALFGAFRSALKPNIGINLWILRGGWELWERLMDTELSHPGGLAWSQRSREWLVEIDGYALAVPPAQALRT
jgi:hypothetical protein